MSSELLRGAFVTSQGDAMKTVNLLLVLGVAAGWVASAPGADNKKLIVGKWEAAKVEENSPLPKGTIMEMKADGEMIITVKSEDKPMVRKGTYTVDGDTFTAVLKNEGKEISHKISILKLTEEELEAANEKKQTIVFKRLK
jgi:uncharacterized protein (TIGR03066 family)